MPLCRLFRHGLHRERLLIAACGCRCEVALTSPGRTSAARLGKLAKGREGAPCLAEALAASQESPRGAVVLLTCR